MKIQPPWYFCCGWWSPWCFLDEHWHRHFDPIPSYDDEDDEGFSWEDAMDTAEPEETRGWLCRKHDQAAERHLYRQHLEWFEEDEQVPS